jgi:type VI secretion system protein ImpK
MGNPGRSTMSDKDPPSGPFGRGERTILRPNPGGRRPTPARSTPAPPPPSGAEPAAPPASADEWIATPAPPKRAAAALPRSADLRVDELVAPNENPIMRAAGPLLLLLGRLRVALLRASFASLMEQVADAIKFFEKDIRSAGIPEGQANVAKYILCATADDIVQNIPTEDRHVWTQYSMLSRFFGERIGGVRFFDELDRAKMDPLRNYPVLELQHACLALGFQGIHRTSAGGQATLQQIQRDLYETLRRVRPKVNRDLSPRWQGQALASRISKLEVPIWAVAGVVGVLLFGLYLLLRTMLGTGSEAAATEMAALYPHGKLAIFRKVAAPPPPPPPPPVDHITQLQRIRAALKAEIAAGKLSADQNATQIFIRVGDLVMFESGEATVLDEFKPIAVRIAETLDKEPGTIKVVGHSDSTPINTVRFPSNWQLSLERARAVAALLRRRLSQPDRVTVDGKGADIPIAPNDTPQGRAKNRRVEVFIPRAD